MFPLNRMFYRSKVGFKSFFRLKIYYIKYNLEISWQSSGQDCVLPPQRAMSLIPGQGTKILYAMQHSQKLEESHLFHRKMDQSSEVGQAHLRTLSCMGYPFQSWSCLVSCLQKVSLCSKPLFQACLTFLSVPASPSILCCVGHLPVPLLSSPSLCFVIV